MRGRNGKLASKAAASRAISDRLPKDGRGKAAPVYIGQLISGFKTTRDARTRTPSESVCDALEAAYSLPSGWMSRSHADPIGELKRYDEEEARLRAEEENRLLAAPGTSSAEAATVVEGALFRTKPSLGERFALLSLEQKEVILNTVEAQIAAFERQNGPRKSTAGGTGAGV